MSHSRRFGAIEGTPGVYTRRCSPPKFHLTSAAAIASPATSRSSAPPGPPQVMPRGKSSVSLEASEDLPRQSVARRPVTRVHPGSTRDSQPHHNQHPLSSHSFNVASAPPKRQSKLLTASQSTGNVVQYGIQPGGPGGLPPKVPPHGGSLTSLKYSNARSEPPVNEEQEILPGTSILHDGMPETELALPPNWTIEVTPDNYRYYVDHVNQRTHWIHPLAQENLPVNWTKIFDDQYGVVYYNESEKRSQYEHPGLATEASNIAQINAALLLAEDGTFTDPVAEDFSIIGSDEIPQWLQMYFDAPSESDHLLNFRLFKASQLKQFDHMLWKLYKQEAIDTVIKFEKPRREINRELTQRLQRRSSFGAGPEPSFQNPPS